MQQSVLNLGLSLILMSALSGCLKASPVFDASAVPTPPVFSEDFRKRMGAELTVCVSPALLAYVQNMDGFADRINRLKAD